MQNTCILRRQPGSNRWPIGLQPIALPLSYTSRSLVLLHVPCSRVSLFIPNFSGKLESKETWEDCSRFFWFFARKPLWLAHHKKKTYWHMTRHVSRLVFLDHKFCESLRIFGLFVGSQIEYEDCLRRWFGSSWNRTFSESWVQSILILMRIIPTSVAQRWWCGLIVVARGIHKMHCSSSSSSLW